MNDNVYYFETIEECEKEIIDKTIIFDLTYLSNSNLFECFVRTIRTIMTWFIFICTFMTINAKGFKPGIKLFGILLLVYIVGAILMSWIKFNHQKSYTDMKFKLVDFMISRCKEYQEADYDDWQKKQLLKRFAALANINIDWDNAE